MEEQEGQETAAPSQDDIDQAQINEWIQDKIPEEVEVEQEEFDASDPLIPLEVVPPPEDPPEEKTGSTSRAFTKLAKKEREIQAQREELKKMQNDLKPYMDAKKSAESGDMLGAMNQVGWNYESATNQVLNDGKPQPQQQQGLNPDLEKRLSAFENSQKKQQIDSYIANLKEIVDTDENYELVRAKWDDTVPMILQLQEIEAKESGKLRDHNNLLDDIEKYYEDIVINLAKSAKLKDKIGLSDAAQPTQEMPSDNSPRKRPRTLRNSVSRPSPPTTREPRTRRERLEEALAVFESQGRSA